MVECLKARLGAAGTGKTHKTKQDIGVLLTASTGIAALNLGDNARTINSVLNYFDTDDLQLQIDNGTVQNNLLKISSKYTGIAIDEASMTPGKQVDKLVWSILNHNKVVAASPKYSKKHNILNFTLIGDIAQLGPVKEEHDPFFKAASWKYFDVEYLSEIKRQSDPEFIDKLNYIRYAKPKEVVDWFAANVGFEKEVDRDFKGPTVFPTNKEVDNYNFHKLSQIKAKSKTYYSEPNGITDRDWAKSIPESITVKPGMRVMILANNFDDGYANGDLGLLVDCFPAGVMVKLDRDGRKVLVNYKTLLNSVISQNKRTGEYVNKKIGSINYLPIRQGDSSSFHKNQGLTFDAMQLVIENNFLARLSGALYNGLTRVTSYQGLKIVGTKDQFIRACYLNPMYLDYLLKLDSQSTNELMAA